MKNQTLDAIMTWMRGTDLLEVSYRRNAEGFDLRLEGAPSDAETAFAASRFVPVSSPGVGIFHFNLPGKPRRAAEAASVSEGDVLGVVETGGKPLEVSAPAAGRVAKILAEEGKAVEYGQPLFLLSQ